MCALALKPTVIDRERKVVVASDGSEVHYDKIVLATGSYPFVPPIPGHDGDGCFVYRTIEDLDDMQAFAKKSKTGWWSAVACLASNAPMH